MDAAGQSRTWLEVALNGPWTRKLQPRIPVTVKEIVEEGIACVEAGAAIVHAHAYDEATGLQTQNADVYAAIIGGFCLGMGFLVLFRHQASLGGINILALYLQDRFGLKAGKFQLVVDIAVLIVSLIVVDWQLVLASVIGSIAMNGMIWVNHRRDRYVAWSAT